MLLPSAPPSAGAARSFVRSYVENHVPSTSTDHLDTCLLVTSELVTNSIRYGTEPGDFIAVTVEALPGSVRVEVHDPARRRPHFKPESQERQRGRGMYIVDHLATDWGVDERPFGKIVWAELAWSACR
ncbi:ATP-binding protein [Streptomyces sp. MST-110588]|nr:ATP-binding protein [Streptomyces sp. MST-110588]